MEDRESSVASSTDFYGADGEKSAASPKSPVRPERPLHNDLPIATKRKADDLAPSPDKKRKLLDSSAPALGPGTAASSLAVELKPTRRLVPAVWQHIFLFCSLDDLGRLLQVNRSFHSYLSDVHSVSTFKLEPGCLRLLKSDSIWASARNALPIKPPKPLAGFSEARMWQLAWSKTCQFCLKRDSFTPGEKIWQKGPGPTGVRTIWPFGIRACGPCLLQQCQTDASMLFSTASALRPALPFALITNDLHYIPAYTLQAATTPAGVEIGKYYFKQHVSEITKELSDAQSLGSAAIEEWSKGLEARGLERMKAAENWERWEVKYQWWSDHHEQQQQQQQQQPPKRAASAAPSPPTTAPGALHKEPSKSPTRQVASPIIHAPVPATIAPQFVHPRPSTIPPQAYTPQPPVPTRSTQPSQRNLHDANEVKAKRRADIERRCQQMDPPIPPNILRHMESFRASIQISQPMTDERWGVLQPRLLDQLPAAQQAEADHVSRVATLPTRTTDRRPDVNSKEAKEVMDREWEESQRVVRDKLSVIADDFINNVWDHGRAVTFESSPKFAVDLLVHVRQKFYASVASKQSALSDPQDVISADGLEATNKPHLVLENMKWVYDNKLKPLTEQYRKELFLCYGSGCEGNTKYYGFEGVIQHYGAKHTNAFSVGNVVVAWREAEWPEETPFHPDPISVKHAQYLSSSAAGPSGYGWYSRAGTSTPHMQPHLPQASPGPYQYTGHFGPFAPPQAPPNGYDYSTPAYGAPMESYPYPSMGPPGYGLQGNPHSYMTSPAMANPAIVPAPPVPPQAPGSAPDVIAQTAPTADAAHSNNLFDKQVSTIIELAQETWKQTSGIKDMPNSLRIYVLLQRVISKFHVEFNHEPNLSHFIDAFSNHEIPKNLKNAPGLACKACQDELSHQASVIYNTQPEGRRTYTVLNLFSHFKSQHSVSHPPGLPNGQPTSPLDWKEDMIELPSDRFISGLIHAPGMDDDKLHIIATVFPSLFPPPLPKIGVVDNNEASSPSQPMPKESKDVPATDDAPAAITEKSGPASLGSPPKPTDNEYDPLRPALPMQANPSSRPLNRQHPSFHGSPPPERRTRYYAEPRYYVPRDHHLDDEYSHPREYIEYAGNPRRIREPAYEDFPGPRPMYREHEPFYSPVTGEVVYARPREGDHIQEYGAYPRQVRYIEDEERRPEFRYVEDQRSREGSPSRGKTAADRFLEEFVPRQPSTTGEASGAQPGGPTEAQPPSQEAADPEDGSRYTPPPPNGVPPEDPMDRHRTLGPKHPTAPSTVSNGSRYEEYRPGGSRSIPTPESAGPQRRPGPHRRRDRYHHHDHHHMPSSRYYRYMSVARDDPYGRSASMNRSQSRRYERYEEQRRRIDQQETPQPNADRDYDPAYSRDQSVDQPPPDDGYYPPFRHQPREYVSVQDRLQFSPPRYRYAGHPEDSRGPGPVYVDEYGPVPEYEIIRVQRDHRQPRGQYYHGPPARYMDHEAEHIQYVPLAYDRPPPQRYESRPGEYVYYEERDRPPPAARRPAFEPESEAYEPPPPDIKVESTPVPIVEGP